jgi:hypothetical protein
VPKYVGSLRLGSLAHCACSLTLCLGILAPCAWGIWLTVPEYIVSITVPDLVFMFPEQLVSLYLRSVAHCAYVIKETVHEYYI